MNKVNKNNYDIKMTVKQLQQEILKLKRNKDVVILAHYYQPIEIQEIADFLGDSLDLSKIAKEKAHSEYIIFAGVVFMAETASILNQDKHILIPSIEACCSLAAYLNPEIVKEFRKKYPNLPVVTYVNSTAAVKAESDISCTSSNAVNIVRNISKEYEVDRVLFGPDANLADYTEQKSKIQTIKMPKEGHCIVHSQISFDDVKKARKEHPSAIILVHPECRREVRDTVDFTGSTAQMYNRVKHSSSKETGFIIGTEHGMLERMAQDFPNKTYHLLKDDITCPDMKKNKLEHIKYLLEHLDDKAFEVKVPSEIAKRALEPIEKMLKYS